MRCGPCGFPDFEGALSLFPTRWSQERNSAFPPWSCDSSSFLMVPLVRALRFTCLLHGSKLFNETFRTDVWTIDFLCFFQYVSALSWIYRDWDGTFSTHWTFWVLWGHLQKGMAWSGDPAYPPIVGGDEGFLHSILSPNSQFPFSIKDLQHQSLDFRVDTDLFRFNWCLILKHQPFRRYFQPRKSSRLSKYVHFWKRPYIRPGVHRTYFFVDDSHSTSLLSATYDSSDGARNAASRPGGTGDLY